MPRCPYKGDVVVNRVLGEKMHLLAQYSRDGTDYGVYSDMVHVFAKKLKGRISNGYQNVVIIDGGTGSGKSNLAVAVLKEMDPFFDLKAGYCYDTEDYIDLLSDPSSKLILVDEATNVLNSLEYRDKRSNAAVKLLDMMRSFGRTSILCTPNFAAVNSRVRNDHTDFMLAIPEEPLLRGFKRRGFFELYTRKKNLWADSPYWVCAGAGVFPPMKGELKEEYERVKREHQLKTMASMRKVLLGEDDKE